MAVVGLVLTFGVGPGLMLAPSPAQAQVSLNLRDADLKAFVEIVSEATGRRFVLDPDVRGQVTVLVADELTNAELYEVFLSVLELGSGPIDFRVSS
jgi:general secretion pathway protein D